MDKKKVIVVVLCSLLTLAIIFLTFILGNNYFLDSDKSVHNFDKIIEENINEVKESSTKSPTTTSTTNTTVVTTKIKTEPKTTIAIKTSKKKNSSTKKKTSALTTTLTTTTTSTTTKSVQTNKTLVNTKFEEENTFEYKYGVKVIITTLYRVNIYDDGSTDKIAQSLRKSYDKSTFNANTAELKVEADSLSSHNKHIYREALNYVNGYRVDVGRNALVLDDDLSVAATVRALEMAWSDVFSHTRPNGDSCFQVLKDLGYTYTSAGENIAYGYKTVEDVSEGWKTSPGHYENMVSSKFGKIGIGLVELNGVKYWVQLFSN